MPQFRSLHTKITQSFDVNDMPDDFTRLTWTWLPLALDGEGRGIYNASWVKARIYPLREDVTNAMVLDALEWFVSRGMIVTYEVDGRKYFYSTTFKEYQRGTDKEARSVLPAPELLQSSSHTEAEAEADSKAETDAESDSVSAGGGQDNLTVYEGKSDPDRVMRFADMACIPFPAHNIDTRVICEWDKTLDELEASGVTEAIMRQAIQELTDKNYKILGPQSIVVACNSILAQQKRKERGTIRQRDIDGPYAEYMIR